MKLPKLPIPQKVKKIFWSLMRKTKQAKPEICLAAGIIAGGATIVLIGVETWKNKDKLSQDVKEIKRLKSYDPEKEVSEHPTQLVMTEDERRKELRKAWIRMWRDGFMAFWKPAATGATSLIFIIGSHNMLRTQLGEMTAAYMTLLSTYQKYRQNVIDDLGTEKDQQYAHGIKMEECIDAETGEATKRMIADSKVQPGPYSFWLDEGDYDDDGRCIMPNPLFSNNRIRFIQNLKRAQNDLNDQRRLVGYLTENDARYALGKPKVKGGDTRGWVTKPVDFGIFADWENGAHQLPVNESFLDPRSNQRYPLIELNLEGDISYVYDDPYEYDNRSNIAGDKQYARSSYEEKAAILDRWFSGNKALGME